MGLSLSEEKGCSTAASLLCRLPLLEDDGLHKIPARTENNAPTLGQSAAVFGLRKYTGWVKILAVSLTAVCEFCGKDVQYSFV